MLPEISRPNAVPDLAAAVFITEFPAPLGEAPTPEAVLALLELDAPTPLGTELRSEATKKAVRDLLRGRGFKPTGRNKPASEYLVQAAERQSLNPINVAVDCLNAVSLHTGLPISVVDLDLARPPFRIDLAQADTRYVFNPSGQVIELKGLLCLFDGEGPCANAVKDSQRTKTHPGTLRTLSVIWGTGALPGRTQAALDWYQALLESVGARVETV
jgi:DNA/RNA-binding domain of Phe-tRNA-synthetase-like protein